jgi:hypothetical protein
MEPSTKPKFKREPPAEPRVKKETSAETRVKREPPEEPGVKRESVFPKKTDTFQKKNRTVISNHCRDDSSSQEDRKLFDMSIKVGIKYEFVDTVKKSSRTVLAPSKQSEKIPSLSTSIKSESSSVFGRLGPIMTNDLPSNQARKSLSKYKWFGNTTSPPSGMSKSSTSSVIGVRGSGQNVNILAPKLPARTVIAPKDKKSLDSLLPKPLMTSTPDNIVLSQQASFVPLRRQSSERHKYTPVQTYAKVIRSKYKLRKVGPQRISPSVPLPSPSLKLHRQKSLTLVKSRTKLVKRHIPVSDSITPKPLIKRNTRYKYQVANKHGGSHSGTKPHTETPRSHKIHLGKAKSSRYRYERNLSNSSSNSQRNWKSKYSLKRDNGKLFLSTGKEMVPLN